MNRIAAFAAVLTTAALSLAACSPPPAPAPTRAAVYADYVDRLKAKHAAVLASVEIPSGESFANGLAAGAPAPVFDANNADASNVAFLSAERLLQGEEPLLALSLRSSLGDALDLLAARQDLYPGDTATSGFSDMLEQAVTTRYVGLTKLTEYIEPTVASDTTFTPGKLAVMVGIMDLDDKRVVASCQAWSNGNDKLGFTYPQGGNPQTALKQALTNSLRDGVLDQLGNCFTERTGSPFNLKAS